MKKPRLVGLVCFVLGLLVIPAFAFVYLYFGHPSVAVSDSPLPFERQIVRGPLHARMDAELRQPSMQPSEQNLLAGATVYKQQCSFCHGLPGKPTKLGRNMFPDAPQLWEKHRNGVVGVSDDAPGETYWRVKNGIRLTGMPSYQKLLTDEQMWQVTILLASAAKPLPVDVQTELSVQ